MGSNIFKWTNS